MERMRQARLGKLRAQAPVLAASLGKVARPGGRDPRGEKHVAHHLTFKVAQKTHTVYVPVDLVEEARAWIAEHRRLKNLMHEISQLSLALVRVHVTQRRRRAGRV
jgi:hypothetical protein